MSKKHFNIVDRLAEKNIKPTLQITEDLKVTINTSIAAFLAIQEFQKLEHESVDKIKKLLSILIGESATEKVLALDLTSDAFSLLMESIMSTFTGEDETPFKQAQ